MSGDMRFYPDSVAPYLYEPTREKFDILTMGDGRGEAVVALAHFKPGDTVFVFAGVAVPDITLFTLQLSENTHIHDPFFMGKVLHSCAPNCRVVMTERRFIAVQDIAPGDCITMDYNSTEDRLFRGFQCRCGSPDCQGMIRGSKVSADDPLLPIHDEAMEQIIAATRKATKRMTNGTGDKPK
ncbi:MAG: SET domain-containing methyltransferase [Rhodospirillaceae bacterium]